MHTASVLVKVLAARYCTMNMIQYCEHKQRAKARLASSRESDPLKEANELSAFGSRFSSDDRLRVGEWTAANSVRAAGPLGVRGPGDESSDCFRDVDAEMPMPESRLEERKGDVGLEEREGDSESAPICSYVTFAGRRPATGSYAGAIRFSN